MKGNVQRAPDYQGLQPIQSRRAYEGRLSRCESLLVGRSSSLDTGTSIQGPLPQSLCETRYKDIRIEWADRKDVRGEETMYMRHGAKGPTPNARTKDLDKLGRLSS